MKDKLLKLLAADPGVCLLQQLGGNLGGLQGISHIQLLVLGEPHILTYGGYGGESQRFHSIPVRVTHQGWHEMTLLLSSSDSDSLPHFYSIGAYRLVWALSQLV